MTITQQQLLQILPNAKPVASVFVPALNATMDTFQINNRLRRAAFIAQVGHESGQLLHVSENLNYSAQALQATWPKRFDAATAARVARQPEAIANIAYASRLGNGPTASGDGWKFRGRGLIQVTGRDNYADCGNTLELELGNHPELLEEPDNAALSAGWFWEKHGLNSLADAGRFSDITQVINGGQNGADERLAFYTLALKVFT
ncbi:glycoside hydrolase family 19 protein [Pseudomonas sp. NA-150]|uniref:glycoside hydrolase family 19 protein n=1 Tax=Pseudomonas sp. NA-150 TaxID=3367525 RepID=UPI0037C81E9E